MYSVQWSLNSLSVNERLRELGKGRTVAPEGRIAKKLLPYSVYSEVGE